MCRIVQVGDGKTDYVGVCGLGRMYSRLRLPTKSATDSNPTRVGQALLMEIDSADVHGCCSNGALGVNAVLFREALGRGFGLRSLVA